MEQNIQHRNYIGTDIVNPLLTDFYQYSMIYAHWKNGRNNEKAVFDLYFRKCPFNSKVNSNFKLFSLQFFQDWTNVLNILQTLDLRKNT